MHYEGIQPKSNLLKLQAIETPIDLMGLKMFLASNLKLPGF